MKIAVEGKPEHFAFRIPLKKYRNWELIVLKNYLHAVWGRDYLQRHSEILATKIIVYK